VADLVGRAVRDAASAAAADCGAEWRNCRNHGAPTQMAMALAMSSSWPGVNSPSLSRKRVSEMDLT
jgi:hypothetical protein